MLICMCHFSFWRFSFMRPNGKGKKPATNRNEHCNRAVTLNSDQWASFYEIWPFSLSFAQLVFFSPSGTHIPTMCSIVLVWLQVLAS